MDIHPSYFFLFFILFSAPGLVVASTITLHSLEIYQTHEWLHYKARVYFRCKGESKVIIPDVKKAHFVYTFNGEESWQPLTDISSHKCKRCGLYEKSFLPRHVIFDEWEFCPSDFSPSDGIYIHMKQKELNASFLCSTCIKPSSDTHNTPSPKPKRKGTNIGIIILISVAASAVILIGIFGVYEYWQKRKKHQEQAKFIQLFEEQEDFDDELNLRDVI